MITRVTVLRVLLRAVCACIRVSRSYAGDDAVDDVI